jgi:hypothetical protein
LFAREAVDSSADQLGDNFRTQRLAELVLLEERLGEVTWHGGLIRVGSRQQPLERRRELGLSKKNVQVNFFLF